MCTYSYREGHTAQNSFVRRRKKAVQEQGVSFVKNREPTEAVGAGPLGQNNTMFVKNEAQEEYSVAAFDRSTYREKLTLQQKMRNDIDTYN